MKPPTYFPALVAITQTPIVGSLRRRITPEEATRLQGIPYKPFVDAGMEPSDIYRQLGQIVDRVVLDLVLAQCQGNQLQAAERLGIELVFATDRCPVLDDPWRDSAIPVRFTAFRKACNCFNSESSIENEGIISVPPLTSASKYISPFSVSE